MTVPSGKSIAKSARPNSRQCGEEGFVPDFKQRHGGEEAPVKSLINCPYVIVNCDQKTAEHISFTSCETVMRFRCYIRVTAQSPQKILGIFSDPIPTFPSLVVSWMTHFLANI